MGSFNRKVKRRSALGGAEGARPVPAHFTDRLEALRQMSIDARDFSVPLDFFHDLAEDQRFMDSSERAENATLRAVLERTLQSVLPSAVPGRTLLLRMGDFWHGCVMTPGFPAGFYYFEQEDLGLLGAVGADGVTHMVRFSVVALGDPPNVH